MLFMESRCSFKCTVKIYLVVCVLFFFFFYKVFSKIIIVISDSILSALYGYCPCWWSADLRCRLSRGDHECVYSLSAAGSFLPSVTYFALHTAWRWWTEPWEKPARVCCKFWKKHYMLLLKEDFKPIATIDNRIHFVLVVLFEMTISLIKAVAI